MCEICGGPHFTCLCPQYTRSSAPPHFSNSFGYVQSYSSQVCPIDPYFAQSDHSGKFFDSNSARGSDGALSRIEELLTQLVAKKATTQRTLAGYDSLLQSSQMMEDTNKALKDIMRRSNEEEEFQHEQLQQKSGIPSTSGDENGRFSPTSSLSGRESGNEQVLEPERRTNEGAGGHEHSMALTKFGGETSLFIRKWEAYG
ncbi:hypothetical protein QVD17_30734 [Tagetes erecta]|uniref:Uncharacterized protein n=1 Tax=Tagetes erecta TaxID=13708 RepID=A0AAD8K461_TARER|nr:hypothetical protein QVD17_30734 [Tagetes erecta]